MIKSDRAYLAFTICPEVRNHADEVVQASVGALIDEQRNESAERVHDQAGFDGSMQSGAGEETEWPLPGKAEESHQHVDDLECGYGLDGAIEVLCEEVPEDLGPEEAVKAG